MMRYENDRIQNNALPRAMRWSWGKSIMTLKINWAIIAVALLSVLPALAVNPPWVKPSNTPPDEVSEEDKWIEILGASTTCVARPESYMCFTAEDPPGSCVWATYEWDTDGGIIVDGGIWDDWITVFWDTPGEKTVTVTHNSNAEDEFGNSITQFNGQVASMQVTVLKVDSVEVRDKNHPANSKTTTGSTTPDLYVGETTSHNAVLAGIASVLPDTTETRSRVNWEIEGNDASPNSGNFGSSSTAEITIDESNILGNNNFVVNVGCDCDDDGSLDSGEVTHSVNVHFIEFDDLKVFDKNNSSVSVTVNESSSSDELYICENLSGDTVITLDPDIDNDTSAFRSHVLWTITGDTATDSSGTFETASPGVDVTLAPDAGNTAREFVIKAGTDDDNDGTLDADEKQYEVKVVVVKLEQIEVRDKNHPANTETASVLSTVPDLYVGETAAHEARDITESCGLGKGAYPSL